MVKAKKRSRSLVSRTPSRVKSLEVDDSRYDDPVCGEFERRVSRSARMVRGGSRLAWVRPLLALLVGFGLGWLGSWAWGGFVAGDSW